VAASTVRALITSVPETSLRELFIEWALAALRYLVVSPESKPTAPTSADRARRHWTKARREAQQRERRRLARAGNSDRRGRKGRANTGGQRTQRTQRTRVTRSAVAAYRQADDEGSIPFTRSIFKIKYLSRIMSELNASRKVLGVTSGVTNVRI